MEKKKYKLPILAIILILISSVVITAENLSLEINEPTQNIEENILINPEKTIELEKINDLTEENKNITLSTRDEEETNSSSSPSFENNSIEKIQNITQNYINLDEITNQTNTTISNHTSEENFSSSSSTHSTEKEENLIEQQNSEIEESEKTIKIQLYKEGKKEIEGKIPENFKSEIKKTETEISNLKKEVIIKSEEHLDSPLTVYSDIKETENKEDIEIYWKNENKKVKIEKYLDTNDNGLIDRISWIVPHLSEQIFEITITPSTSTASSEIELEISGLEGTLTNPISFTLDVDYSNLENLSCKINFNGDLEEEISLTAQTNLEEDLPNGNHNWKITCKEKEDSTINKTLEGNFTISEQNFEITNLEKIYLSGQEIRFNVLTPQDSEFIPTITNPSTSFRPVNEGNECILGGIQTTPVGTYYLGVSNNYYAETAFRNDSFYIAKATISPTDTNININEEVDFVVNFESTKAITYLIMNYGNSKNNQTYNNAYTPIYTKTITFHQNYTTKGTYTPKITFIIEGIQFEIESETIKVNDPADENEAPEITLTFPKENSIIESETITFKYKVADDGTIKKCVYELYKNQDSWKELDYTTTDSTITLDEENEIKLTSFEDGDYTWYILCEDTQGKETEEDNDFTVKTTKHEYEEEINEALTNLDNFLKKIENYKLEEKDVLNELGIIEDLTYYKKRLNQIDQDLGTNIKFITNENLKKERTEETIDELNEIIKNIPKEMEIKESTEFIKNSLTDLETITTEYIEGKKIQLKSNDIKRLAQENQKIQEDLSITTKIKTVEITYKDRTEKITSVKKEINVMDESYKTILEKIPNEIKEIEFRTQSQEVNKNLFEIKIDNIENDEIVYYIKEDVKLNNLKEAETILFEEFSVNGLSITGYFSFNGSGKQNSTYFIIFIIFLAIAIYFGKDIFKKLKMNLWKKEEDVRRVLEYSEKAKQALQDNNQEIAKQYYHKIKEIFNLTPTGFRNQIYPIIKNIRIGIDKRDMQTFIKEYEQAKTENRKEDAQRIYKNIQDQYKKLPKKYQEKVYEKVIRKGTEGFSF
jgi:hypothetical protein